VCGNKQIRSDRLEEAVWRDVCSVLSNPQSIEQEWQRRFAGEPEEGWDGSEQLRRSIDKIRRGTSRLIESYQDGLLEKAEFEPRIRTAKDRLATLQSDLKRCLETDESHEAFHLVIGRMREFAAKVTDGLEGADWTTRRAIIRAVVKRVEIDEQEVRVVYKITPDPVTPDQRSTGLQYCWGRDHRLSHHQPHQLEALWLFPGPFNPCSSPLGQSSRSPVPIHRPTSSIPEKDKHRRARAIAVQRRLPCKSAQGRSARSWQRDLLQLRQRALQGKNRGLSGDTVLPGAHTAYSSQRLPVCSAVGPVCFPHQRETA
jgi:hypothetical protein